MCRAITRAINIFFEHPQHYNWLDNAGDGSGLGFVRINNAKMKGPVPFDKVRFNDKSCGGVFYGDPGSTCSRTSDQGTRLLYIKQSANTTDDGWVPAVD